MFILAALACSPTVTASAPPPPAKREPVVLAKPVTVFVVRHAEKAGEGGDVPLTEAGQARANALAMMLKDVPLRSVRSTDTLRTRSTALPTAEGHGLELELYDPSDVKGLIASLSTGGPHLVVGHSNTVPVLVEALGAEPGRPIEELEFDRLYVITKTGQGPAASSLLRYGSSR